MEPANESATSQAATGQARRLLQAGILSGTFLRDNAAVGAALPIRAPDGAVLYWFVPVLAGDLIAGYFRTDADFHDWRWSSFQRRSDSLAGCPPAVLWLDEATILDRTRRLTRPDESLSGLQLSFDRVPDRLAWAVRLKAADGTQRIVFVAGNAVWSATEGPVESYE